MSAAPITVHHYRTRRRGLPLIVKCCLIGLAVAGLYWVLAP